MDMNGEEKGHLVAFARTVTMFVKHVVKDRAGGALPRQIAADIAAVVLSAKTNSQTARAGIGVELVCWAEQCVRAGSLV